jgi:hypothetical protein
MTADIETRPSVNRSYRRGGAALTGISAADAGAATPKAIGQTIANKSFFIAFLHPPPLHSRPLKCCCEIALASNFHLKRKRFTAQVVYQNGHYRVFKNG